jgi:hypothetical protein
MNLRRWLVLLLCAVLPLGLIGCAGYSLGPSNGMAAGERSIQIRPFMNQTLQPRLTDVVTQQVRKQVQRDGTFTLATHDDGDLVVSGTLIKYQRHELSFSPRDILTVQDFRVELTAQVKVTDRSSGKVILDKPISGITLVRVGSDLVSAERQAMPILAADLARNIIDALADGEW